MKESAGRKPRQVATLFESAHGMPYGLQRLFGFSVHWNVAKNSKVVAAPIRERCVFRTSPRVFPPESAAVFLSSAKSFGVFRCEERRFRGQASRGFILAGEFFRFDLLASTSGWLNALMPMIEPARGSDFPAEKFLAEVYTFGSVIRMTG